MIKLMTAALGRVGVAAAGLLMLPLLGAQPVSAAPRPSSSPVSAAADAACLTGHRHGTSSRGPDHSRVTPAGAARVQRQLATVRSQVRARTAARKKLWVTIPVYAHVIHGTHKGEADMTAAHVRDSIRKLNQDFRGAENGGRLSTGFIFKLKSISFKVRDEQYHAPPMSAWDKLSKRIHHRGYRWALNVYFSSSTPYRDTGGPNELLGWARFPWEQPRAPRLDGVTVHPDTRPGGPMAKFNQGNTLTHEVGHWLGLYHIFQGGCRDLDYVADTPAQAFPILECSWRQDTCPNKPGTDRLRNYMGYAYDRCMNHFTRGQITRMETAWLKYRARNRR